MDKNLMEDLIEDIEEGRWKKVINQLKDIKNIDYVSDYGFSLLAYAVINNQLPVVKTLIERNCTINIKDLDLGQICLHYSSQNGNLEMTKLLLENGADPTITDDLGNEPLDTAVFNSMLTDDPKKEKEWNALIKLLIEQGGHVNHKNNAGISPLDFAKEEEYEPLIDLLEKHNKN